MFYSSRAIFSLISRLTADNETADPIIANGLANAVPHTHTYNEGSPLLVGRDNKAAFARKGKVTLAALYAIQVFYSFFIMCVIPLTPWDMAGFADLL